VVVSSTRSQANDLIISEQHVQLARTLGQGKGKVSERCMYYRKPPRGLEAGWVVVQGTNAERQQGLFMKGFVPLQHYGFVNPQVIEPPDPEADTAQAYRTWAPILTRPGGPEEFPVSQLIEYRWYDPRRCPVPGVRFPQLEGASLTKFWCPECETVYYHKAIHLARHLRSAHEWDRAEIGAYGKEAAEGRAAVEAFAYSAPDIEPEPVLPPIQMDVEDVRAPHRGRRGRGDE
jgi:hypothetical protein